MNLKKLFAAVHAAIYGMRVQGVSKGRAHVRDSNAYSAFPFRMPAGFPGDVNRTHPASIEPMLMDPTSPVLLNGNAGVLDATSHKLRRILATEQSDATDLRAYALVIRPYPLQQQTGGMSATLGGASVPPTSGVIDGLRGIGYIMAQLNVGVTAPVKGGRVYVWAAATSGNHILGGYETDFSAGNTVRLTTSFTYNGPADANGVTEIVIS